MLWRFAQCEDEKTYRETLEALLYLWAKARGREIFVHSFEDAGRLLGAWKDTDSFDALFLDIELPGGMDGLTFAENVRRKDKNIPIVFITIHGDHIAKGYALEVLDFIIKPVVRETIFPVLDRLAYRLDNRAKHYFECRIDRETVRYPMREILYFVSEGHYITLNGDEDFRFREKVDSLQGRLPRNFVRIHRSIIVNMDHVFQYGAGRVILDDARRTEHPVGRGYMENFIKTISEYRRFF